MKRIQLLPSGESNLENSPSAPKPSVSLLAAAAAGLFFAGLAACGHAEEGIRTPAPDASTPTDPPDVTTDPPPPPPPPNNTPDPKVISSTKVPDMTYAKFAADCEQRGGFVQSHAVCSGNNTCKGVSFNKFSKKLIEHTCRGANSCGGISCVVLPADTGKPGKDVYASLCGHCHGEKGSFTLPVPPGTDLTRAEAGFLNKTSETQATIVAFGTQGVNPNGSSYTNMPPFYQKLSRGEIIRVVEYLRSLPPKAEAYSPSDDLNDKGL